jgi:hypothetical protein
MLPPSTNVTAFRHDWKIKLKRENEMCGAHALSFTLQAKMALTDYAYYLKRFKIQIFCTLHQMSLVLIPYTNITAHTPRWKYFWY